MGKIRRSERRRPPAHEEWEKPFDEARTPGIPPSRPAGRGRDRRGGDDGRGAREARRRPSARGRGARRGAARRARETDARRAEEETAKAHEAVEAAEKNEEKLSRKERKAKENAEQAAGRGRARRASRPPTPSGWRARTRARPQRTANLSGANVMAPGLGIRHRPGSRRGRGGRRYAPPAAAAGREPSPLERPEVAAGVAFAGAFLVARILKRLVD